MDTATTAVIIAGVALAVNIILQLFGGGWKLNSKLSEMESSLRKTIVDTKNEIEERQDRMAREFGETAAAIRQKVHEIETWARDEFVRKGSFEHVLSRSERTMSDQFTKIETRLERMEAKIDARN